MEKRQDFPDAALTQEKARQQIRARHKAWRMELPKAAGGSAGKKQKDL